MLCSNPDDMYDDEIRPHMILINTMSAFAGTQLDEEIRTGVFIPSEEKENLEEERELLSLLELPDCYFWALHPLDSVRLDGMLGKKKQEMLDALAYGNEHVIRRVSRTGML